MRRQVFIAVLSAGCVGGAGAETLSVSSPNGQVAIRVDTTDKGVPRYEVRFHDRVAIAPSPLGLALAEQPLQDGFVQAGVTRSGSDTTWRMVAGKAAVASDHYNELAVVLKESRAPGRRLELVFRAYDDGAAFRYRLPPQPGLDVVAIRAELTQFNFAGDYACLGANLGSFGSSHEMEFDPVPASRIRPPNRYDAPLVCSLGKGIGALALAEADLRNYAGMYLSGRGDGGLGVQVTLAPRPDDPHTAVRRTMTPAGVQSPWRVVMLADEAGKLIESTLLANLSAPAQIDDTNWIRPGKAAWDWWSGPYAPTVAQAGSNDDTARYFIDFAAEAGLQYALIDEGWYEGSRADFSAHGDVLHHRTGIDIPALVDYGRERGVGLWLWLNWQALDPVLEQALALYEGWGVKGIKVDFMDRDDQVMVEWYEKLVAAAARHHLMVDMHGAYHPTGMTRTWPNFITQEGVLGAEYNKWSRRVTASHNVTLAYTRLLLGPMDYTPGGFNNVGPEAFEPRFVSPLVQSTRAQALAMYVVYESPFACVSDSPANYRGQAGLDFLAAVPTSWDETRFLAGDLGEYVVVARRRGTEWYIGAMNNEHARSIRLKLDFLAVGSHVAHVYADGKRPTDLVTSARVVRRGGELRLALAGSGGAAIRITQ
jgi:alpha-glucosidase